MAAGPVPELLKDSQASILREAEMDPDPFRQFQAWLDQVLAANLPQPYGMTLATATSEGLPSARMVLLRGFDPRGFAFFTNYDSRKSKELDANPRAALVFYWPAFERQVRIEGHVEMVSEKESDIYFATRPRDSQLSAWGSPQSEVVANREVLEQEVAMLTKQFEGREVPRPPRWGGYRVVAASIEFWQSRPGRLHDRLRYLRQADGTWKLQRLAP